MNFKKFIFLFCLIHCVCFKCFSQKNFSEGYIIYFNGDTASGKINDFKSAVSLNAKPIKIKFINKGGKEETYLANKIKGYCKAGIVNYLSINDLAEGPFFAKILIQGPITLLSSTVTYNQSTSSRYFLKHAKKKSTYEVTSFEFKKDMAEYFSDHSELKQMIINKELRYTDLEIIVKKYNAWYETK